MIRRYGTNPDYKLYAYIVTTGPISRLVKGIGVYDTQLAADKIGANGGVVRVVTDDDAVGDTTGKLVVGKYGSFGIADHVNGKLGFFDSEADFPNLKDRDGSLTARAGYYSDAWGPYVRTDGSKPMTGSLNMGGNSIAGVDKVKYDLSKIVNWADYCDGKDASGNPLPAPNNKDMVGSQAMTSDGQIATCRAITAYTASGIDASRKVWAKSTPGYTTSDDIAFGSMDDVISAPMYLFTDFDGTPLEWKTFRILLKRVPANITTVYIPLADYNQPGGFTTAAAYNKANGGEVAAIFVKENPATHQMNWVGGGPFRVADWQGNPVRWTTATAVSIPGSSNTGNVVGIEGPLASPKNWVYEEWLFGADGISKNTYASVPLTVSLTGSELSVNGVVVAKTNGTPVSVVTNAVGVDYPGSGSVTADSAVDLGQAFVPGNGAKVTGTFKFYTPYSYSTRFQWQGNFRGQICRDPPVVCLN